MSGTMSKLNTGKHGPRFKCKNNPHNFLSHHTEYGFDS